MNAFILAAGLGTRLRPITLSRPKALVSVGHLTLLELAINRLSIFGIDRIVINVHHFADQIVDFVNSHPWNVEICISDERQLLLDTGAALQHAKPLFIPNQPILVHNVDILSSFDLHALYNSFLNANSLATLAVSQRNTSRLLLVDSAHNLVGWINQSTGQQILNHSINPSLNASDIYNKFAFSGIALLSYDILNLLPPPSNPYPIIPEYIRLSKSHTINVFEHSPDTWMDVGKPDSLQLAADFLHHSSLNI